MASSPLDALKEEFQKAREEDKNLPTAIKEAVVAGFNQTFGYDFKEKINETFSKIGDMGKNFATGLGERAEGIRDSFFSGLATLGSFVAAFVGLQAGLEGFEKAEEWFGANPDWGKKISSAIANIVATFTGLSDTEAKSLALKVDSFITGIGDVGTAIANTTKTLVGWYNGDTTMSTGDLLTSIKDLGTALWDNKVAVAGITALLLPGTTIRLAIAGITTSFSLMGTVLGAVSTGVSGIIAVIGAVGAVGAATIIGTVALVANTINALWQGIKDFKKTWDETGSFMEGLNAFSIEFMAQFIGWPVKLLADATAWVAGLFGFDDVKAKLNDIDPVQGIRDFLTGIRATFAIWDANLILAWASVKEGAKDLWAGLVTGVSDFIDSVKLQFEVWTSELVLAWINVKQGAIGVWTGLVDGVKNFIQGVKDQFAAWTLELSNAWTATKEIAVGVWTGITDKITSFLNWIYNPETGAIFGIDFSTIVTNLTAKAATIANDLTDAVWGVITDIRDYITGWVKGIWADSKNWIKDQFTWGKKEKDIPDSSMPGFAQDPARAGVLATSDFAPGNNNVAQDMAKIQAYLDSIEKGAGLNAEAIQTIQNLVNSTVQNNNSFSSGKIKILTPVD